MKLIATKRGKADKYDGLRCIRRDGSESAAYLRLPPDSFGSQVEQALERHLGELDFQFKRQAQVISDFVDSVAEVKAHFDSSGRAAKE